MGSQFQGVDLSKECRIYFQFLAENGRLLSAYYSRPNHFDDSVLQQEAAANAKQLEIMFGLKQLLRTRIVRTLRQLQRAEFEITGIQNTDTRSFQI